MLSFRQYLIEQLNIHPHNVGHETDDVGTTIHTYEDFVFSIDINKSCSHSNNI